MCHLPLGYFKTETNAKVIAAAFLCPRCRTARGYVDYETMKEELRKMRNKPIEAGYEGVMPLPKTGRTRSS